jgi:hypothetical protein
MAKKSVTHTPGPWETQGPGLGNTFIVAAGKRGQVELALVYKEAEYDPRLPMEANARLIAAAPDLLEAARNAILGMDGGSDDARCHKGITTRERCAQCRRVDALTAAVLKAEGK